MNPNDLVIVRFTDPTNPTRHDARWSDVQKVVGGLQLILENAVGTVFTPDKRPAFGAILVASPRKGSLELLLQFPLLETLQFNTPASKALLAVVGNGIDGVADLAGIASFVLALVLSRRGVVAEVTGQAERGPGTPLEQFTASEAKRLGTNMAAEVRQLMSAAYETGMEVDVEYRDYGRIRLNPADYQRSGRFIGRHRHEEPLAPTNELEVTVANADGPRVRYNDHSYRAVIAMLADHKPIVLLTYENRPLPAGKLTIRGGVVEDLSNLHAESNLPDQFATAHGPFLVSNFAVWQN